MTALKTLIFTVLVPGTVTVLVPYRLLGPSSPSAISLGGFRLFGLFFIALGAIIYLRCAWDFTFIGRGTPAPIDPPKHLVSNRLYRIVRNPMYVGVGLILFGEAAVWASSVLLRYAFLVVLGFHLFVVYYEEPTLKRKFGSAYEAYRQAVPRW